MSTKSTVLLWFLLVNISVLSRAQSPGETPTFYVKKINETVRLDGVLDEDFWQETVPADKFWQWFPIDTAFATNQTEIHMAFDDNYLYAGIICYSEGDNYVTNNLRRDYRANAGDNITLVFDPFRDNTNAFIFGINPFGVRREALISGGGREREDFQTSWDNKWDGEAKRYPDRWTAEIAIPFKTLRFNEGETQWGFNSYRFDMQSNERSTWVNIPRNLMIMDRAYNGDMIWEESPPKPGNNISLIPYLSGALLRDHEAGTPQTSTGGIGGDAKIAVTPSLSLDLTINPDFSQVEVDRQVTNLDRFEIFFPERRQFFLENSDIFANLGTSRVRPFFSRRIGVAVDTTTGQNIQNPIFYGMRLSGKLNPKWRLGLLNMQTAPEPERGVESRNFTVATVQRQFGRSFASAFLVNKQGTEDEDGNFTLSPGVFNRVMGIDYNLATVSNRWRGKFFAHRSMNQDGGGTAFGTNLNFNTREILVAWEQQYVQDSYDAETGFIPRKGYFRIEPAVQFFFYPESGYFNTHGPAIVTELITDEMGNKTDHKISLAYEGNLSNTGRTAFSINHNYIRLLGGFDPSGIGLVDFPEGSVFEYVDIEGFFSSDNRKKLSMFTTFNMGQYFNGYRFGARCSLQYRIQPLGIISADINFNQIQLTDLETQEKKNGSLFLVGPRFDLTFTRKLFLTTLIQYNSQLDNLNVNARLQWRFKPVSDFFLVYTDNYLTNTGLVIRNRSIVAKLTYWLNL